MLRRSKTSTDAGASAEARYRELYVPWRRHMHKCFPVAILPIVTVLALLVLWRPEYLGFSLGVLVGVTITTYVWAVEPPDWMEKFHRGAVGEQKTAMALSGLGPEWRVVHDVPDGDGNIDHILIGPGGVFVLETKNLSGRLRIDGERIVRHFRFGGDGPSVRPAPYARGAAKRLSVALRPTGQRLWVNAVVVVWGDLDHHHAGDNVTILPGDHVVGWLLAQPVSLTNEQCERVHGLVVAKKSSADGGAQDAVLEAA